MRGTVGAVSSAHDPIPLLERWPDVMGRLVPHRGPDGAGTWMSGDGRRGFGRRRLEFIDLGEGGARLSLVAWGLFSLELWHQTFHDQAAGFRVLMDDPGGDHVRIP